MLYVLGAAITGGVVSLSTLPWKIMPWDERAMVVFVGAVVGIYLAPWVAVEAFNFDISHTNTLSGITFTSAGLSQALMYPAIKWVKKRLGLGEDA